MESKYTTLMELHLFLMQLEKRIFIMERKLDYLLNYGVIDGF